MFVMSGSTTLRVLDVAVNKIGDDGVSMISEELQHNNSLSKMVVQHCGLSVKGEELPNFAILVSVKFATCICGLYSI